MPADKTRGQYDDLARIAQRFGASSSDCAGMLRDLKQSIEALQGGDWIGQGATAFYAEMGGQVLPALQRLVKALASADKATRAIAAEIKRAEQEAAALLKDTGAQPKKSSGGLLSRIWGGVKDAAGGLWEGAKQVGGFVEGFALGAWDMAKGLWQVATHPVDTLKGLWYGIQHPGEVWEALKKPYVEDWESGNYGRAIGRGAFEVLSLFAGGVGEAGKGAEAANVAGKALEASRLAEKAAELGKTARVAERAAEVAKVADEAGEVGRAARVARYVDGAGGARYLDEALVTAEEIRRYEAIASQTGDAARIAEHVGVSESITGKVKEHLFMAEHDVPVGPNEILRGNFAPDGHVAGLWEKANAGTLTATEASEFKRLLAHEYVESKLMESGMPYRSAHPDAWAKGYAEATSEHFGAHDLAPLVNPNAAPFQHWSKYFPGLPADLKIADDLSNLDEIVSAIQKGVR